jgi:hypothetical protein
MTQIGFKHPVNPVNPVKKLYINRKHRTCGYQPAGSIA